MHAPDWAVIEGGQRGAAGMHVIEPAQPDKGVRIVHISELADDLHAARFLAFQKIRVEHRDQTVTAPGVQRVTAQFRNRAVAAGFAGWCNAGLRGGYMHHILHMKNKRVVLF